jgi:hypothetical protein
LDYLRPCNGDITKWTGSEVRKIEPGFLDQILADEELLKVAPK